MAKPKPENKARSDLLAGVNLLGDTVKVTLGPQGRYVVIEQPGSQPLATKDGATVAAHLEFRDPIQNAGASLIKQAAARTKDQVGDGSTTATVLAQVMVAEGAKYLAVGVNPVFLRVGIDLAVSAALLALTRLAVPCSSEDAIRTVAHVATNGDAEIADLISRAIQEGGPAGLVRVEEGRGRECTLEMVGGFVLDGGYLSRRFVTSQADQKVKFDDCRVLVFDGVVETVSAILPLLERVAQADCSLLIVAGNIAPEVLTLLAANVDGGNLKVCAVKPSRMGEARTVLLDDLAAATGTELLSAVSATTLKDIQMGALGAAGPVEVSSRQTILFRPKETALEERLRQLDRELQDAQTKDSRAVLRSRIANLKNAVSILRVGADTSLEMSARLAAAKDAVGAVQAAAAEGIVPGGGVALVRSCQAVRQLRETAALDVRCGFDVVLEALTAPFRQILTNAGIEPRPVLARVAGGTGAFGFNATTGTYGDLQAMGVLDPTAVVHSALRNAASVAVQLLSTEVAVASGEVV